MKVVEILNKVWNTIKIKSRALYEKSKKILISLKNKTKEIYNKVKTKFKNLTPARKKRLYIIGSSVIVAIVIFATILGVMSGRKPNDDTPDPINTDTTSNLTFGAPNTEYLGEIVTSGGVIEIDDAESSINGLKIIVQGNSYNMPVNYSVKTYPVTAHKFGLDFNPITPLIEVNNGHEFSRESIIIEIPINITSDRFAMGFYYDAINGTLEAIPTVSLSNDKITIGVKHFSKIIISDISLSTMQNLTAPDGATLDTGFVPLQDDWHYYNYGSAIAPGGHCAGQSLTMSWYYSEKYKKESASRLYGSFDNNNETDTPDFWEDDNNAYRFSSVIQNSIDWSSDEWIDFIDYCVVNPKSTLYAFAYAIKMTNTPQFMAIFPENPGMGHAIVAYKVAGNRIYVADPNFPGQKDRYVEYNPATDRFLPYSSGANANDINSSGAIAYSKIVYVAKTALIDYDFISSNYDKMIDGSVGDSVFPDSNIEVMTKYNSNVSLIEWNNVPREINLDLSYTNSLAAELSNKAVIRVTPLGNNMVYSLYLNNNTTPEQSPVFNVSGGSIYYEVDLNTGINEYGFLVELSSGSDYYYIDFIRVRINYSNTKANSVITFNSNGGTNINSITQEIGSALTAPTAPVKPGYSFVGWYTDVEFNNLYSFTTMSNANLTLYAKWVDSDLLSKVVGIYYLSSIDDNRNLGIIEYQTYEVKADGTYVENFKRTDSSNIITDSGTWSLVDDILTFDNGSGTYNVIADGEYLRDLPSEKFIFVYKRHSVVDISVTITFDSNGGSSVSSISLPAQSDVFAPTTPTKAGYSFGGWYYDSNLTLPFTFIKMPNKDTNLYAKWISASNLINSVPGTYDLTYIGGVGEPNSDNTQIVSETYYLDADGTFSFIAYRKDTDVVNFSGTWTLNGNILTINGFEYIFSGSGFISDGCYPWTYVKR